MGLVKISFRQSLHYIKMMLIKSSIILVIIVDYYAKQNPSCRIDIYENY